MTGQAKTAPAPMPAPALPVRRTVSFKEVEIRRHGICVGDNPCTLSGPPVALDWSYSDLDERHDLDEYEADRTTKRGEAGHRKDDQMKMPKSVRVKKLREGGVSFAEMRAAELDVLRSQHERCRTVDGFAFWRVEAFLETVCRRTWRALRGTSKRREQERLWDDARRYAEEKKFRSDQTEQSNQTEQITSSSSVP